jgi:CubicO group peptidase (beta-lactamase class C family)
MNTARLLGSSYLARYLLLNTVDISDYQVFPARRVENAPPAFHFTAGTGGETLLRMLDGVAPGQTRDVRPGALDAYLAHNGTTAFLIIKDDSLLVERYYNGYGPASVCTSFSTAKAFVSAMVGVALDEGLLVGIDDPLPTYLPELAAPFWSEITIRHLIGMCSGLAYDEAGFFPWNDSPRIYYTPDLRALARRARRQEAPGLRFHYNNYNLVLLGMILERVTGGTVSAYLQEKIWKPLGMEANATWSLDSARSGMEKMESGLNARAVDFAKFGRLYLRGGDWDGRQIIPEAWVRDSTTVQSGDKWSNYKYLWWIARSGNGRFMAVGNLAQFIYLAPDKNCLILRFGKGSPRDWRKVYPALFARIADLL